VARGAALAALLIAALAWPDAVAGHGIVLDSAPRQGEAVAAPKQLVIRFNSRLEKRLCSVTVVAAAERRVLLLRQAADAPADTLIYALPPLDPGSYQARWKVLAADGHVTEGAIEFTVTGAAAGR
jgi:methionine-rich copper-binding protein CopC